MSTLTVSRLSLTSHSLLSQRSCNILHNSILSLSARKSPFGLAFVISVSVYSSQRDSFQTHHSSTETNHPNRKWQDSFRPNEECSAGSPDGQAWGPFQFRPSPSHRPMVPHDYAITDSIHPTRPANLPIPSPRSHRSPPHHLFPVHLPPPNPNTPRPSRAQTSNLRSPPNQHTTPRYQAQYLRPRCRWLLRRREPPRVACFTPCLALPPCHAAFQGGAGGCRCSG